MRKKRSYNFPERKINLIRSIKRKDGTGCLRSIVGSQKTLENVFRILRKRVSQETIKGCPPQKRVKPRTRRKRDP